MDLNTFWFVLIAILFTGLFHPRGFRLWRRYSPAISGDRRQGTPADHQHHRPLLGRVMRCGLSPAGGAMFAAFPHWYATLFSGFYLALFLMLAALIVTGRGLRVPKQG